MPSENLFINELLSYACHFMKCSALDNIKKIIDYFYTEEEILESKQFLWSVAENDLEPLVTRKSTNKRSGSSANLEDILDALNKLDSEDKLPKFVAYNLSRVPDRQPEELNLICVINRLATVENKLKQYDDTLSSHAVDLMSLKELNDEKMNSRNLRAENETLHPRKNKDKDDSILLENAGVDNMANRRFSDNVFVTTPGIVKQQVEKINKSNLKRSSSLDLKYVDEIKHTLETDDRNDDGFIKVESTSARKKRLSQERRELASARLKGAPPPLRYVFLSRVEHGDAQMIVDYMKYNHIDVRKVETVSHANSKFMSFKVTVFKSNLHEILSNNFWPQGIVCRLWKDNLSKLTNSDYNNLSFQKNHINNFRNVTQGSSNSRFNSNIDNSYNIKREFINKKFSNSNILSNNYLKV